MRIIKEGKPPENQLHETVCQNCNTVFQFMESEANLTYHYLGVFLSIACPICKRNCSVSK